VNCDASVCISCKSDYERQRSGRYMCPVCKEAVQTRNISRKELAEFD